MKRSDDPRHVARALALQTLFHGEFSLHYNLSTNQPTVEELLEVDEYESYKDELYREILSGIRTNQVAIDNMISENAPEWPIEKIKLVDLQILRIAIFEGFIGKLTPPKVAIDEAIELAREFGGQNSDKFVNGVLGAVYTKSPSSGEDSEKPKTDKEENKDKKEE